MKLTFDLKRGTLKTVFICPDREDLTYLIDTGADTPVWCKGEKEFLDLFPDAEKLDSKFILSGFGKEPEVVDVYKLSEFSLTDGNEDVLYRNLVLAVTNRPQINVDLILPSSLFDHMIVEIDRMTSVVYPHITIQSQTKEYPVFFRQIQLTAAQKDMLGIETDVIIRDVYAQDEAVSQ